MNVNHRFDGPEDAPVLVLSNSLGTTLELWDSNVAALAHHRRVLRYDQRGHGGSDVPPGPYTVEELGRDVISLLDELGIERVSFCGLSIGGVTGLWLGANAPDRIDRLVLACTGARIGTTEMWTERAATVRAEGTASIAAAVVERWFTPGLAMARPELVARFRAMVESTPDEGYAACCDALRDFDFSEELGRIAQPTLVLAGSRDPATPPELGAFLAEKIPAATLTLIEDVAHLANVAEPGQFSHAVLTHLEDA
ncbi:MAG TPA: 3-oxoadipate enol-lactonase [Gaiellaceae bacterium]|nr:3-oxoadipate enol-lactonase [Gaiellaceae bacterium]